ncbi:hypothetical protein AgCh_028477 [Apium graveolens]
MDSMKNHVKAHIDKRSKQDKLSLNIIPDNSGDRAAPSDVVPGPSGYKRGVAAGWAPAKQHRKGGLAPTAPPV